MPGCCNQLRLHNLPKFSRSSCGKARSFLKCGVCVPRVIPSMYLSKNKSICERFGPQTEYREYPPPPTQFRRTVVTFG
jgi:hypothetical protein